MLKGRYKIGQGSDMTVDIVSITLLDGIYPMNLKRSRFNKKKSSKREERERG